MKIAICITTHNRPDVLQTALSYHNMFLPGEDVDAAMFVVDDASDPPAVFSQYRFEQNVGIARSKNKCLELAVDWGAEHIFLFDDDCWPIAPEWWIPYVNSKEPHLMYQFKLPGKPAGDMREVHRDDAIVAYSHTRGCMIYIDRIVLDRVGGMDTAYGTATYEHPDWSNRIYNAGLTTYRAMDVPDSGKLIYCLDQDAKVESSLSAEVRKAKAVMNWRLYVKSKKSKGYREFR